MPGNASGSNKMRQTPSCSPVCWRNGDSTDIVPPIHLKKLGWSIESTGFTHSGGTGCRENPRRHVRPVRRLSRRRSPPTLDEVPLGCSTPNIDDTVFLNALQRTTGEGSNASGAVTLSAYRALLNGEAHEQQNYNSRAAFLVSNESIHSSVGDPAGCHIWMGQAPATREQHPFQLSPPLRDRHKVSPPVPFEDAEDARGALPTALNWPTIDSIGAAAAPPMVQAACSASCINRKISPFAGPTSCASDRSHSASFRQHSSSCMQALWASGMNEINKVCLPSERSKQEESIAPRGTRRMLPHSVPGSPKRSQPEWCWESKQEKNGDLIVYNSEERPFPEHRQCNRSQWRLPCAPTAQPSGSHVNGGLPSESSLSHLSVAIAEPPGSSSLPAADPRSGGQLETESETDEGRVAAAACTPTVASTFWDYTFPASSFSSDLSMFLSPINIPYISPEEARLGDNYYVRCPLTFTLSDRFRAAQQISKGPPESDAARSREELHKCASPNRGEHCGPNRRKSTCTNFPLDTLEEPLAHNRFTAVAIVSGEPVGTPKKKNVEGDQEEEGPSITPLPGLRGRTLVATSVNDSPEPQPEGQRIRRTASLSVGFPRMTQMKTVPRRASHQEEEIHEEPGKDDSEETQMTAQDYGKNRRQEAGDENLWRQRPFTAKQGHRNRLKQQQIERQQQGSKGAEHQGDRREQHDQKQQIGPFEMHEQHAYSPRHEDYEREHLASREYAASNSGEICGTDLQQQRHHTLPLDGSASSSAADRSLQGSPFAADCTDQAEGTQRRNSSQCLEEDGEKQLPPLHHMPEGWLQHEMQALLREEYQQRQIVQRREEQQHEALQQHPPLERPWVFLAQKQQEEDFRRMHQATLQQMQQELLNRHERQIQARLQEDTRTQQGDAENERQEAIRLKQQQKQNHQKQLRIQQPTGSSKARSTPITRRRTIFWQHRQEEQPKDQPLEIQNTEEKSQKQFEEEEHRLQLQREEVRQTQNQQQQQKQEQPYSPAGEKEEDTGKTPKQQEQQLGPLQQTETTYETEGVAPSQTGKQRELVQTQQQPTQTQEHAQQVQQQQQHDTAVHEEVSKLLQQSEATSPESSKQKVQQALQKDGTSAYGEEGQQKQQLLTQREGHEQQQSNADGEQTSSRQPKAWELQKGEDNPKQKGQTERDENHRGKQNQQRPYQADQQTQQHSSDGLEVPEHHGEKRLPDTRTQKHKLAQQEGRENEQQGLGVAVLPQARKQLASKEKQKITHQQQQEGVREIKHRRGQTQADNQRMRTQQHNEQPKQRWLQQKEHHQSLSRSSQPQTRVQRPQQQPQQQQQENMQEQQQRQEQKHQQQQEIHQQKEHHLERQGLQQEQQQRLNKHQEGNSTLTRAELLRLSFTPLAAVRDNELYLHHHLPNRNSSLPLGHGGATTSAQQPSSRIRLPDTPIQPHVATPRGGLNEGRRSGNAKAPPLLPQHADGRHFSKGQQSLPNQRWTPLQIPQQQSRESKLAESKSANNLFRRRNPIPPPPPPVASITQSLQHPEEQWKMAPMRGIHQPKNPRSRQRQLHQEQRRLQKQPKQPAVHLPVRVPENPAGHRETQQNAQRQNAALHQDVQQQQQLQGYYQHVPHDLAASASSKRGAKRNSRSSHSGAGEPDPFSPFVSGSRPTWAQKAVEGPPKREFRNDRDHRTEEALRMSVEAEGSVVKADLGRTDNEQAAGECIDGQDRRFGKSEMFLNRQLPDMQGYTHRRERQEQRLKEQTLEQKQRDRLNPIVLQVHQQLEQARLEFLEEQTRGQARSGRVQLVKEARKQEDQQQQSLDEAEPKQGGERHELPQPHQQQQHQQQQEQQRQEQHENSMPSPYPVCHQQQPVSGSGQLQQEQQQQQERQHPYGGHQQEQRRGHPEQQLQQGEEVRYLPRSDIQQPSQTQAPNELQHQSQQQQLPEGMERHRQHFQQQDAWPQQRARQSQHPLGMQQQVWFQQHQQQDQQYQQERLRPTQQQQQQHQPPPQEPFIYEQQYTNPPQQSQPAMPLLHPLVEQQQQQAWLQAQLHLSLQQQQHAWLLINQQRSWLLQQHHPLTPSQQHLWTLQQQQFWQQQQLLWQLQQPHAWLQQQQHIWLQHHQQAHLQQQLLHRQQNQQQHQHGLTSFQYGLNCIKPYAPPHVLSDTILGAAENAANIRHFLSCGMRMPPPWDGCIPSENMSLGFCRVCLQYVDRDRYMPPVVSATAVASSPAVMTGVEEAADDFHEQEPHQAEFLSHEQRISTASADAAGGPPGVSLLPEAASGRADCATEVHDDTFQQVNATAMFSNNNSNNSPTIHNSNNSVNDRGGIYDEYPTSSSNTSGSNSINNSRSRSRTSNTAQRNHRMNMTNWEEGDGGSNNHGDNNMATDSASFGTFQPPDFSREDSSGSSGQIDSIVPPGPAANPTPSILQAYTAETHQNQLHQHLQQQLQEGPPRSRGLVAEASAGAPNRNPTSFSALNPSAPVFVPARNTQPASPTFASAIAAAAAAANQETLAASIQGNPTAETRQWNTQQTNPRAPMNFCGQIYPTALQQQQRNQQPQQQSQNQQREPQGILEVQFPPANGQTTCDLQPNVQQPQLANQSLQHLPQSYQHLNPQRHQQQQNAPQQNEQQSNEQPAQQQHYPFPSFISSSLSDFVPFLDSSTRQGSLIVTGVCLQCWQFVVRPPVLCLLDQLRAKGIGPDATENCQPIKYEE